MSSRKMVDKSITNILWSYLSFFSTKLLNLISIIILARFMTPSEFGVAALALVIIGYFELITAFGLGASLISASDAEVDEAADAVFWTSIIIALCITVLLWVTSDSLALFFGNEELAPILDVLGLALIIEASAAVHNSLLRRDLRFRRKLIPDTIRGLVKGFLSIFLAFLDFGVWALVWGHLAGVLSYSISLMVVRRWRPRGMPKARAMATALRYGVHLVAAELINTLPNTLDSIAIGRVLGPSAVGVYSVASRMPKLAISTFTIVAGSVIHPVMAQLQNDRDALQTYYYGLLRYFSVLMLPLSISLAIVTDPLINLLYPENWHGMIVPMQLLCIAFGLGTVNLVPGMVYKAINKTDNLLYTALLNLPLTLIVILATATISIEAVAIGKIILVFIAYAPNFFFLHRTIGVNISQTLRSVLPGLSCAAVTGCGAALALWFSPDHAAARLVIGMSGAAVAWLLAVYLLMPEVISEIARIGRRKIGRKY